LLVFFIPSPKIISYHFMGFLLLKIDVLCFLFSFFIGSKINQN